MNKYHLLSLIFFILGIISFTIGVLSGEVEAGFILIFPSIIGSGITAFLGFIFIFFAIILFMFGFTRATIPDEYCSDEHSKTKTSVKGGGVVLIGPIPIIFGSNWKIALVMIILAIILIIITFFVSSYL